MAKNNWPMVFVFQMALFLQKLGKSGGKFLSFYYILDKPTDAHSACCWGCNAISWAPLLSKTLSSLFGTYQWMAFVARQHYQHPSCIMEGLTEP